MEANDFQGEDHTCGERVWAEILALEGIIADDHATMQAEVDHLWQLVNPGVNENDSGTTLQGMWDIAQDIMSRYPVTLTLEPVTADANAIDQAFANAPYVALAVNINVILPWCTGYHFLLGLQDKGGFVHVIDSDQRIDFGSDVYLTTAVASACAAMFGWNAQCGWAITVGRR